jgi:hypothetical protein
LIDLLPSHGHPHSTPLWGDDGNGRLTFWMVAGMLFMSLTISGNSTQELIKDSDDPPHGISSAAQEDAATRSARGIGTD